MINSAAPTMIDFSATMINFSSMVINVRPVMINSATSTQRPADPAVTRTVICTVRNTW